MYPVPQCTSLDAVIRSLQMHTREGCISSRVKGAISIAGTNQHANPALLSLQFRVRAFPFYLASHDPSYSNLDQT